jgi:hypothetical protein
LTYVVLASKEHAHVGRTSLIWLLQLLDAVLLSRYEGLDVLAVKLREEEVQQVGMHFLLALEDVLAETVQL